MGNRDQAAVSAKFLFTALTGGFASLLMPSTPVSAQTCETLPAGEIKYENQEISKTDPMLGQRYADAYQVRLKAGQPVQIDMIVVEEKEGEDSNFFFDPFLDVTFERSPTQAIIDDDDGGSFLDARLRYTPTEAGCYTIRAQSDELGKYTLTIRTIKLQYGPIPIAYGESKSGEIGSDDQSQIVFPFAGKKGDRVVIDAKAKSEGLDPYLELTYTDPRTGRKHSIARDDDSGDGLGAQILAILPAEAEYKITVTDRAGDTGPIDVALSQQGNTVTAALPEPLPVSGSITPTIGFSDSKVGIGAFQGLTYLYKSYFYQLKPGQPITVQMSSDRFQPFLLAGNETPVGFGTAQMTSGTRVRPQGLARTPARTATAQLELISEQGGKIFLRAAIATSDAGGALSGDSLSFRITVSNAEPPR